MTAGFIAAGVMSGVRLVAHRAGLIERMVPQVVHERAAGEADVALPGGHAAHQLAAELIHHAVAAAAGGLLGAVRARPGIAAGAAYGLAIWAVDVLALMPALGERRLGGSAVDGVAHAVFGVVLAFAMRELAAQRALRPLPTAIPMLRRVG